jgi:hypothetical protein
MDNNFHDKPRGVANVPLTRRQVLTWLTATGATVTVAATLPPPRRRQDGDTPTPTNEELGLEQCSGGSQGEGFRDNIEPITPEEKERIIDYWKANYERLVIADESFFALQESDGDQVFGNGQLNTLGNVLYYTATQNGYDFAALTDHYFEIGFEEPWLTEVHLQGYGNALIDPDYIDFGTLGQINTGLHYQQYDSIPLQPTDEELLEVAKRAQNDDRLKTLMAESFIIRRYGKNPAHAPEIIVESDHPLYDATTVQDVLDSEIFNLPLVDELGDSKQPDNGREHPLMQLLTAFRERNNYGVTIFSKEATIQDEEGNTVDLNFTGSDGFETFEQYVIEPWIKSRMEVCQEG